MEQRYSIFTIASWFLSKEALNYRKLLSLCYLADAWYYTLNDKRLSDEDFYEAWVHGPRSRQLVDYFNKIELNNFNEEIKAIENPYANLMKYPIDEITREFLEEVWDNYGQFYYYQIIGYTQDEAWAKARIGLQSYDSSNNLVSFDDVKEYYSTLIDTNALAIDNINEFIENEIERLNINNEMSPYNKGQIDVYIKLKNFISNQL